MLTPLHSTGTLTAGVVIIILALREVSGFQHELVFRLKGVRPVSLGSNVQILEQHLS